jgi:hypothetical protein
MPSSCNVSWYTRGTHEELSQGDTDADADVGWSQSGERIPDDWQLNVDVIFSPTSYFKVIAITSGSDILPHHISTR